MTELFFRVIWSYAAYGAIEKHLMHYNIVKDFPNGITIADDFQGTIVCHFS